MATGAQNAHGKTRNDVCAEDIIRPRDGTVAERPMPMNDRKTSIEMYDGSSVARNVTMTDVRNGSMFLEMTRGMGVPRQRDAREYSLSRIIMTCVLKKNAIGSQPVTHSAKTNCQNPEPIT